MIHTFNLKQAFKTLGVNSNDLSFLNIEGSNKKEGILKLWEKIDQNKKQKLKELFKSNLEINNDFFLTIPLLTLYKEIQSKKEKNDGMKNIFYNFDYNEINPTKLEEKNIIKEFLVSNILNYNFNSSINFKIINISFFEEKNKNGFTLYNIKGVLSNVKEYMVLLRFILNDFNIETSFLENYKFNSNSLKLNKIIDKLIKEKEVNFDKFIQIIGIKKEVILSSELGNLVYNLDFSNNNISLSDLKKQLDVTSLEEILNVLYLYAYIIYK